MRAAILLNGEAPNFMVSSLLKDRFVICADGAYDWAAAQDIKIDILAGDFDSVHIDLSNVKDTIDIKKYSADKNMTDGQICLDILIERGYKDIIFLGGGGKRDDHFFAAIQLLYRALLQGCNCIFYTNYCEIYITDSVFLKKIKLNTTLSLVPFFESVHIIYTKGLRYKLTKHLLKACESLGVSNVVTDENVEIKVENGIALIFLIK